MLETILHLIKIGRQINQPQLPLPLSIRMLPVNRDPRGLVNGFEHQPRALILPHHIVLIVLRIMKIDDLLTTLLLVVLLQIERVGGFEHPYITHKEYIVVFDVVVR
jgi:hypothetical protein